MNQKAEQLLLASVFYYGLLTYRMHLLVGVGTKDRGEVSACFAPGL